LGEACDWQIGSVTDEHITTYQELIFQLVNKSLKERITLIEFTEANLSPKFTNLLIIFCIAVSFDNTGAFRANQSLSNIFSAIIYSLRLMAISYVLWKNNCRKLAEQAFDLQHYIQTYHKKYLNVNRFTVFGEIQHMRAYIRKCEKYHVKEGCIEDVEPNVIRYAGEEIKISELRKSIHQLINDCEVLLYDKLLYIHPNGLSAQVNIGSLKKNTKIRARGY
jgi:hypothetical protein